MHALRKFELSGMKKDAEVRMKQRTHHDYGWRNVNMISRAVSPAPTATAPVLLSKTAVEVDRELTVTAVGDQAEDIRVMYARPPSQPPSPVSNPKSGSLKVESEEASGEKGEVPRPKRSDVPVREDGARCATDALTDARDCV